VIKQPQTSIVAAFGSFGLLVLVEFAGPPRRRLMAYAGLVCAGAAFLTLGTICSRSAWLGAGAMAVIGFGTLYSGAISGYFAAATTAAILTFVLAATIPAPNSAIPDRLEGWGLAAAACIGAAMLLWPPRRRADLQLDAARALHAVADFLDAGPDLIAGRARAAREAVDALGGRLLGTAHRPTGPAEPTAALAALPDELDWLLSFFGPSAELEELELASAEDREALAAAAAVLRASAERLEGHDVRPDLDRLEASRDAVAHALMRRLPELPASGRDDELTDVIEAPFRIRAVTYAARQVAGYALRATGAGEELDGDDVAQPRARAAREAQQLAVEHASSGSVWFQNSIRGAAGLAIAVYIAQRTGLQHSFWVVLGTLSVLRSNALGTGWSVLSALAGTAAGLVVGALVVIAIGTHEGVFWAVLPLAILLAAYAPRAISFAAGQAGFTVVLFILFNIIQPVGWKVGLIRVEDVAIGFAISLGVGLLFWPRGAAALLRQDVATGYARSVEYVVAAAREVADGADRADTARAGRAADGALHRLDDAFRQYLTERAATAFRPEDAGSLVGGAARVRRAGQSIAALGSMLDSDARLTDCGANLDSELHAVQAWFITFGYALTNDQPLPPPHLRDADGRSRLMACVRTAAGDRDEATVRAALVLLWTSQHLDNLWRLEGHLRERADAARAVSRESGRLQALRLRLT
jgi:uncharacterized membrane protein YccC